MCANGFKNAILVRRNAGEHDKRRGENEVRRGELETIQMARGRFEDEYLG